MLLIEPAFQRGASLATPGERSDALTGIAIGTMQPAKLIAEALREPNDLRVGSPTARHRSTDRPPSPTTASRGRSTPVAGRGW